MFSTQCEAEGFRRITYYPDRPDVMAPFGVRIESDLPVSPVERAQPTQAPGPGWAEWATFPGRNPPTFFALVAGELVARSDGFTTASGREVALNHLGREGDEGKMRYYALDAAQAGRCAAGRGGLTAANTISTSSTSSPSTNFNVRRDGEQGPQHLQQPEIRVSPRPKPRPTSIRTDRGHHRSRLFPQLDRQPHHLPRLVPALPEGGPSRSSATSSSPATCAATAVKRIETTCSPCACARQFREATRGPLAHPVRPDSYIGDQQLLYTATPRLRFI